MGRDDRASDPHAEIRLEIPPRLDYLAVVRLVIAAAATMKPTLTDARLDDLRLAVTEACSNAIKAQRREGADEPVEITCRIEDQRFIVTIRDHGPGFDPDQLGELPGAADPRRLHHESGLGIPLIRVLTDEVSYDATSGGTTVVLTLDRATPH